MGVGDEQQELTTSLIAQRIAQGFRSYLMGLMTRGDAEVECKYDSKTENGKTQIEFNIQAIVKPVPFESVDVHIEFKHR